jgi:chromosome segregation ATPase
MPCEKCKNENYKWGKTGSCEYDTKEECEKANKDYYKKNNTTMKQYPTPLGKKSYEEYEKELKEYNLSHLKRVDFKDVKTLKKLSDQIEKLVAQMDSQNVNVLNAVADYQKFNVDEQSASENLEKEFDNYRAVEKRVEELEKEKKAAAAQYAKLEKVYDKARDKKETMAQKVFKANDKYKAAYKKGDALADKLDDAIREVNSIAKSLGVDVPTGEPRQILAKFRATSSDALKNVNFDY